jgi:hypothetical protein
MYTTGVLLQSIYHDSLNSNLTSCGAFISATDNYRSSDSEPSLSSYIDDLEPLHITILVDTLKTLIKPFGLPHLGAEYNYRSLYRGVKPRFSRVISGNEPLSSHDKCVY